MAIVHVMPSWPTASPENTDVIANPRPLTMPTMPFMFARRPSGTSSVTQVDSAIPRALSTIAPRRISRTKPQNARLPISSSERVGTSRKNANAAV